MTHLPAPQGDEAAAQIIADLDDMYAAFMTADWDRFNVHVDPTVTAWETHLPDMILSQAGLDEYRASRPAPQKLASFGAHDHRIDTWGDTSVARYLLSGLSDTVPAVARQSRVTEVFRWDGSRWRIVHRHSERLSGAVAPL